MIADGAFLASEIIVDEVDSTNDLARRLLEEQAIALPWLVLARRQSKGRGQGTNEWWSDEGSLTFSIVLDAEASGFSIRHEPLLALISALAILETVKRYIPPTQRIGIRWPNDIEAGGRKLGGILTERINREGQGFLIIGIGMNVGTRLDQAPREVREMACSLADFGTPPEKDALLRSLIGRLESMFMRLRADDPELAKLWAEADLLLGQSLRVKIGERLLTGVGRGIDERGALLVGVEGGVEAVFGGRVLR